MKKALRMKEKHRAIPTAKSVKYLFGCINAPQTHTKLIKVDWLWI